MKYFVTGANGFIGTEVVKELLAEGHQVIGLVRTEEKAQTLNALGAETVVGSLEDLNLLKEVVKDVDGVAHLAFPVNFDDFAGSCTIEKNAIVAIGDALEGTNKPFIGTSGLLVCGQPIGSPLADETFVPKDLPLPFSIRAPNEETLLEYKKKDVKVMMIRLSPTVHGKGDKLLTPMWMGFSKQIGWVPVINGGENTWCAVHKTDAAKLYARALEKGSAGSTYHAIGETQQLKTIAAVISKNLGLESKTVAVGDAPKEMGPFSFVFGINAPASAEKTKKELGWNPTGPTLFEDIENNYT